MSFEPREFLRMTSPPERDSAGLRAEDLQAFWARDWDLVAREKERWWAERGRELSVEEKLRISDMLRRHVQRLRPDWPSPEERRADLETHIRVSEALRRVPRLNIPSADGASEASPGRGPRKSSQSKALT